MPAPEPLSPDQQETERRPCRVHPAVHLQQAVCRFCGAPFRGGRYVCGHTPLAPSWRCIEGVSQ